MNALSTKLGIGVAVVTFALLGAFLWQTTGETTINVTLKTNEDLENGLVGHWTFDGEDMVSNVADRSGQGNHGSLVGQTSTTTVSGVIGQALEFDGSDDYVLIGDVDVTGGITIAGWVKPTALDSNFYTIVSKRLGSAPSNIPYGFDKDSVNVDQLRFYTRVSGTWYVWETSDADLVLGWQHVAVTYDEDVDPIFYVNGEEKTSAQTSGSGTPGLVTDNAITIIGRYDVVAADEWNGTMDDVRLYNRALSADEVSRLYDLGGTTRINTTVESGLALDSGLVGHWTFDGADLINNVVDRSGKGNNGTFVNITSTTTVRGVLGQALELNDSTDYVDIPDNATLDHGTGNFTYNIWAKITDNNTRKGIMTKRNGSDPFQQISIYNCTVTTICTCTASKKIGFIINQNPTNRLCVHTTNDVVDDEWHMITLVRDGALSAKMYVDGVNMALTTQSSSGNPNVDNGVSLKFGYDNGTRYFDGTIDDARVYNRALSASEVARLYDLGATTRVNTSLSSGSLDDGLVGHWTFDGADMIDNVSDRSSQGNDGSLQGQTSTSTVRGVLGQALEFDGSDDYVNIGVGVGPDHTSELTISAWIKPADVASGRTPFVSNTNRDLTPQNYSFEMNRMAGQLGVIWGGSVILTANTALSDDTWYHVVLVRSGSTGDWTARIYLNGVDDGSASTATNPADSSAYQVSIGSYGNGSPDSGDFFTGPMDDVRIYNRALSADEVERLYGLGR